MKTPTHVLWWGVGFLILGSLAEVVSTSVSFQSVMVSDPVGNPFYYWLLSPVLIIIQNAAFPLGAALIGASVVMRYVVPLQSPRVQQQSERSKSAAAIRAEQARHLGHLSSLIPVRAPKNWGVALS